MTSRVFSLVAQKLSKDEFKEYKKVVNDALRRFTGRTLAPANLNECAATLLGADNSNVMSKQFESKSIEDAISGYLNKARSLTSDQTYLELIDNNIIPLVEFSLWGDRVICSVEVIHQEAGGFKQHEGAHLAVHLVAPDPKLPNCPTSWAIGSDSAGGNYGATMRELFSNARWAEYEKWRMQKVGTLNDYNQYKLGRIFDWMEWEVNQIEPSYIHIVGLKMTEVYEKLFGYDTNSAYFHWANDSEYDAIEGVLYTGMMHIASDIAMVFSKLGQPRCIQKPSDQISHLECYVR